jgi:hypothetical protein
MADSATKPPCGIWPAVALTCFVGGLLTLVILVCMNHQSLLCMFVVEDPEDVDSQAASYASSKAAQASHAATPPHSLTKLVQGRAGNVDAAPTANTKGVVVDENEMQSHLTSQLVHELQGVSLTASQSNIPPQLVQLSNLKMKIASDQREGFNQPMTDPLKKGEDNVDLEVIGNAFMLRGAAVDKVKAAAKQQKDDQGLRDFKQQLGQQPLAVVAPREPALKLSQPHFNALTRALAERP